MNAGFVAILDRFPRQTLDLLNDAFTWNLPGLPVPVSCLAKRTSKIVGRSLTAISRTALGAQRNAADVVGPVLDGVLSQIIG